jgi:hypothetical protein
LKVNTAKVDDPPCLMQSDEVFSNNQQLAWLLSAFRA